MYKTAFVIEWGAFV
jgi:hypothetical protein